MVHAMQHGSRQHISWSSKVYRAYVEKMVEAIEKHYVTDKRIWGWQLDNEPSHYGQYDYSDAAQESFRNWLKVKYKTLDSLNTTWGTAFWSIRYNDFNQIRIPNQKELIAQASPHAVLDFKRFSAEEANDFLAFQYKILRKYIPADQWITTNLMPEHVDVDPTKIPGKPVSVHLRTPVAGQLRQLASESSEKAWESGGICGAGYVTPAMTISLSRSNTQTSSSAITSGARSGRSPMRIAKNSGSV